uniref:Uncharacterized protein n=1 Tax=Rhizophora mucronata TaxID=61149 RepID=A0A2P2Q2Y7_RHIMU
MTTFFDTELQCINVHSNQIEVCVEVTMEERAVSSGIRSFEI